MTGNPNVRKVTLTGSTEVGRTLMQQSADTVKKLSLELGGNAPFILFNDADLDAAIAGAEEHTEDEISKGARIMTGGKRHALGGTFFEPTVLADMSVDAKVSTEETFGPLAPLFRFESDDDAVRLANDTEFGLASYFYSRDVGRIWRVAEALESGIVGTNTGLISTEVTPFTGVKQSGLGRKGSHCGMDEFLEVKYLCFGGLGSP